MDGKLIGLLLAALLWASQAAALPDFKDVEFVRCHDGDTCTFLVEGEPVNVRLAGIDAPEIGRRARCAREQKLAEAAKGYLEWQLKRAKRIDLVDVVPGLNRLRARVLVNSKDLSALALKKKRVRPYNGGKRKGWC